MVDEEFHAPDRQALVERFVQRYGTRQGSSTTWALLWFGDIERLTIAIEFRFLTQAILDAEKEFLPSQMCKLSNPNFQNSDSPNTFLQGAGTHLRLRLHLRLHLRLRLLLHGHRHDHSPQQSGPRLSRPQLFVQGHHRYQSRLQQSRLQLSHPQSLLQLPKAHHSSSCRAPRRAKRRNKNSPR